MPQLRLPPSTIRTGSTAPCPCGRARIATPTAPSSSASQLTGPIRWPFSTRSARTIQIGTVAISSAVRPAGRVCSAYEAAPFPNASSIVPTTAMPSHCARRGRSVARSSAPPPRRAMGNSTAPAIRYRIAAMASGGMLSTPTRIATYVEPHTTQTTSRQAQAVAAAGECRAGPGR